MSKKVCKSEQIAIMELLLDILVDDTRYDSEEKAAARIAYARFKAGDQRIQFHVQLQPGVWAFGTDGDGRTLHPGNAGTYSAREAVAVLADIRQYLPLESARIYVAMKLDRFVAWR